MVKFHNLTTPFEQFFITSLKKDKITFLQLAQHVKSNQSESIRSVAYFTSFLFILKHISITRYILFVFTLNDPCLFISSLCVFLPGDFIHTHVHTQVDYTHLTILHRHKKHHVTALFLYSFILDFNN